VPYEAMVNDVETEARRLISHVGLAWDDACLKFYENRRPVRTASVAQVRRPIYKTSVARWVSYGDLVNPLREIVGEDYPHGFTDVPPQQHFAIRLSARIPALTDVLCYCCSECLRSLRFDHHSLPRCITT